MVALGLRGRLRHNPCSVPISKIQGVHKVFSQMRTVQHHMWDFQWLKIISNAVEDAPEMGPKALETNG